MSKLCGDKLLSLVLIPAILLAQLVCICSSHAAAPPQVTDSAAHDCCNGESTGEVPGSSPEKQQHDEKCPHCTSEGRTQVLAERADTVTSSQLVPTLAQIVPSLLPDLLNASAVRTRAFSLWQTDSFPPPDILRVKCTLQI